MSRISGAKLLAEKFGTELGTPTTKLTKLKRVFRFRIEWPRKPP